MDLRSGTTTKTDNVISSTASVETENEFADPKIAVETENGDYSECVSTENSVDTDNEKHSEFDPEHSVDMDNENSQFVDSDNSVVTENGVQNEITLSSLAGMLSRLGDIMCENKCELHTSMTRLEEKIDRNQNDIYQFNNSMKIMEDKLNNSSTDIARLEKNVTDQFHAVGNEIGHVKNNFKNIVPQLKTDLRKDLKVELTGILKQEISTIKDTLQQEITVIVQGKNDSLRAELLDIHNSLRTELAEANESLRGELTGINDSLRANLVNNVDSNRDELFNATNDVTDESNHKNGKNSVETDSVHKNGIKSVVTAEMSAAHHEQELTPERNGQENSPSHSAQDSGDSDSDTVREHAPERDMSFSFQVAPPDWFTDYMSVSHNKMDRMYQNLNETIQRNEQSADFRYTSLKKQLESVQQQVSDNAIAISNVEQKLDDNTNAILSVTTGFSKFSATLMTVQCKLDALPNRCDPKMSTPSTVGSDNTDVKRRSQSNRPVATTTTFSQQSSVYSTVKNAPPVYQTIPHLSTHSPACYPYQNAPNLARKTNLCDQWQSVLQVTSHMPVPPPSHIPVAHSTSPGMAKASNNPVAQSTSQGMSHNTPSSTQVLAAEVGSSSNSKGTVRSPQRRSPSVQYLFPKGSESPNWRERSSPPTQYSGSMSPNWREKNYSSFKPEQGSMTSAIQNGSSRRSNSISPSRNKTYSQCYGCREYGHHRYECPRRNISPSRRWSGRNSSNSPPRARYPRPGERY